MNSYEMMNYNSPLIHELSYDTYSEDVIVDESVLATRDGSITSWVINEYAIGLLGSGVVCAGPALGLLTGPGASAGCVLTGKILAVMSGASMASGIGLGIISLCYNANSK